jgi:hypothetical protein
MGNDLEQRIGKGVQLFRVRFVRWHFKKIADLGPLHDKMISGRQVLKLKGTDALYALLTIPYKDEEIILVRADNPDWAQWDWEQLARIASECRWRGPHLDKRWI